MVRAWRILAHAAAGLLAATVLASCAEADAPSGHVPEAVDLSDPQAYAAERCDATNRGREAEGLAALERSTCAADAATARAAALVGSVELAHAALDDVIRECAPATGAAENLARQAADPGAVVEAWLDSPGHRENLLSGRYLSGALECEPDGDVLVCSHIFLNAQVP